ncbi:MAG: hypothetical protein WD025_03370 [Bacteriovoracaceae bacterium]
MKKTLITLFIVLNFMMMIRAQIDTSPPLLNALFAPATYIQDYFSVYRGWKMFAPNPTRTSMKIEAEIEFLNGEKATFQFPSPKNLTDKYIYGERFRKYQGEGVSMDKNSHLWPDTAKWALRQHGKKDPFRIPARVHLIRKWKVVPKLESKFVKHMEKVEAPIKTYKFYTYEVL